jgi:hypothetical protein
LNHLRPRYWVRLGRAHLTQFERVLVLAGSVAAISTLILYVANNGHL